MSFSLLIKKLCNYKKSAVFFCGFLKIEYLCTNKKDSHISRLIGKKTLFEPK